MASVTHMIVPSGPTLLGEKSQYRLSKNDLLLNYTVSGPLYCACYSSPSDIC